MKKFLSFAVLFLFGFSAFAQPANEIAPLKDGDKIGYKYIVYGERGRDLFEEKTSDLPASVIFSGKDYSVKYDAGRIEGYNEQHILTSVTSRGKTYNLPVEEQFLWMPKDFSVGKKEPVSYLVQSNVKTCTDIRNTFPESKVESGVRAIKIQGAEKQVPVHVVTYKGAWSGSCGRGNFESTIVFSAQMNFILERKELNYLPSGFLYMGYSRRVDSLN